MSFRLDTVESRTQALRDIVYVSEGLGLLKGILLLLDELEKQDYSLSKTPVLRFLSAIRALVDALPQCLFLILAMTGQARRRYFAMLPALAGRLQDTMTLQPINDLDGVGKLYEFYTVQARRSARLNERVASRKPSKKFSKFFDDDKLKGTSINGGVRYFCDPDVMFLVYEGSGGGDSSSTGQEFGNPTLFSSHFMPAVRLFAASAPTYPANHTKRRML